MICASREPTFKIKTKYSEGVRIVALPNLGRLDRYVGHFLRMVLAIVITSFRKYDIVHGFCVAMPATAVPTLFHKYIWNSPIISDWDETWTGSLVEIHPVVGRKILSYLERTVPLKSDGVVVVSDYLKDKALKCGVDKNRIHYIQNGVNLDAIPEIKQNDAKKRLGMSCDEHVVVSVGNVYMGKTFSVMLEAIVLVAKEMPKVKLYIVGNPYRKESNYDDKLLKRAKDNIVFVGPKSYKEALMFMAAADVLVLPMENSLNEIARSPIRLGDYILSGRPIVSNAVGEVKKVLDRYQCGLTCDPSDIEGFAQIISRLLRDKSLQEEYSKRSKAARNDYSWDRITEDLSRIYERVYK